jgi:predicted dehydrogenase
VCVRTIVDVDENLFPERVKELEGIQGIAPSAEYDLRRTYDDKDIDAVVIATTDHWHALGTIWACQAGKHVYVEKPCSHNIREGRKMVEAARKYNRIVAVGFQSRSSRGVRSAIKFLRDGGLGEVYMARGLCFKPRDSISRYPDGPVPDGEDFYVTIGGKQMPHYNSEYLKKVHYDLWLGPAPERPFNRNRFHYNWHWYWDYGCGDIGNQGPHELDIARWGLGEKGHPVRIKSSGGFFAFNSDQETPNTQSATYEYADGKILQFDVRGLYTNTEGGVDGEKGRSIGNLFYGTKGWMALDGGKWRTYFGRDNEPGPSSETTDEVSDPMNLAGSGGEGHFNNFITAVRSGNRNNLNSDIASGSISTALAHLANISYRLGRQLTFDGEKEKFVGDGEADRMLTRKYRQPYVVPERV